MADKCNSCERNEPIKPDESFYISYKIEGQLQMAKSHLYTNCVEKSFWSLPDLSEIEEVILRNKRIPMYVFGRQPIRKTRGTLSLIKYYIGEKKE